MTSVGYTLPFGDGLWARFYGYTRDMTGTFRARKWSDTLLVVFDFTDGAVAVSHQIGLGVDEI